MGLEVKREDFGIEGEFVTDVDVKAQAEEDRLKKEEIEKKLTSYEEMRVAARKTAFKYYYIFIPIAIVIAIFGFLLPAMFIVAIVVLIVGVVLGQSEMNKVKKMLKEDLIVKVISDTFPGSTYSITNGVSLSEVMAPRMVSKPDRYHTEDMITAKYKNIPFILSDVVLEEKHTTTDSNGHTHTSYSTYFKGKFIKIDLIRDLNLTLKIYEKSMLSFFQGAMSGLEKVETESIAFNKKFKTISTSQQDAFYVLTPQIQEKFLELEKSFNGNINFCFQNGYFYCLINDGSNGLEVNPSKPIDKLWLNEILNQINLPATIIDEFHFDSDKWINNKR